MIRVAHAFLAQRPSGRALYGAALAMLLSCSGSAKPPAKRAASRAPKPAASTVSAGAGGERTQLTKLPKAGLPLVRIRIRGHSTLALFDTGSTAHLLSRHFLKTIEAKTEPTGNEAVDHNGKPFRLERVRAPLRVEGFLRDERGAVFVADLPKALHEMGVGAIVSPSLLVSSGERLEIDLENGIAVRSKAEKTSAPNVLRSEEICKDESGGSLYGLSAMIVHTAAPPALARLLVDTGSDRSDLFKDGPQGKALLPLVTSIRKATVATGEAKARSVDDIEVRIGAWRWLLDLDLISGAGDPACPRDGVLGMDALARCKLVYQANELTMSCE